MAKDEIVRISNGAAEVAAVKGGEKADALLLKKKLVDEAADKAEAQKDQPTDEQVAAEEGKEETAEVEVAAAEGAASDASPAMLAGVSDSFLGAAGQTTPSSGISNTTLLVGGGVLLAGAAIVIASNNDDDDNNSDDGTVTSVTVAPTPVAEEAVQSTFKLVGNPGATVSYTLTGTAKLGEDYTISPQGSTVTFDANGEAVVTIISIADSKTEGAETVILTAGGQSATLTINDTSLDFPITIDPQDPATVIEGGTVIFKVNGAPGTTVPFSISGAATSGDYTVVPDNGQITFDEDGVAFVSVKTINDGIVDGGETLTLTVGGDSETVTISDAPADSVFLTTKVDNVTANKIFSNPEYTPGGNDFVNTLQDEDTIRGSGVNPTLDAIIGNTNDNSEGTISPILLDVRTAQFAFTGGGSNQVSGIDFLGSDRNLVNLGVTRITAEDGDIELTSLKEETNNLFVSNATKDSNSLLFSYAEGELENGADAPETVNLYLNNVRLGALSITQGDAGEDEDEDEDFSAEVFNINVGVGAITDGVADGTDLDIPGEPGGANLDSLFLEPNAEEDQNDGTDQTVNFLVNKNLEINDFSAQGAEFITIQANADMVVADDEDDINGEGDLELKEFNIDRPGFVPTDGPGFEDDGEFVENDNNDGWFTGQLQKLTIAGAGNVSLDSVNGDVGVFGDDQGLEVDAAAMTGDLRLGIDGGYFNGGTAFDDMLKVTSGSGDDWIVAYGILGGDITTNAGNDNVEVRGEDGIGTVMLGTSIISTGTGDDDVSVEGDLLSHLPRAGDGEDIDFTDIDDAENDGFDDVQGATILTGDGNDRVSVGALQSTPDGDNGVLDDVNTDDLYFVVGPTIDTGIGNDYVEAFNLEEGALITTGAGTDSVVIFVDVAEVLGADNSEPALGLDPLTQEVNKDKTLNTLGAIIDLGSENDSILFTDEGLELGEDGGGTNDYLIVGEGAEVRGGGGTNVFTVETVDRVDVVSHSIATDFTNTLITGFQTANFTALNAIGEDTSDATDDDVQDDPRVPQNDNGPGFADSGVTADIGRFDSALTTINLTSEEQPVLLSPEFENYEEGNNTYFELNNLRAPIAVNLIAHETHVEDIADDVEPSVPGDVGAPADDYVAPLDFVGAAVVGSTNVLLNPFASEIIDVQLDVDYDVANAQGNADTFTLKILPVPAGSTDKGQFDLDLFFNRTEFDTLFDPAASTTDDDDLLIENVVLNLTDSASHLFDLNGFGDYQHTDVLDEGTRTVETSLTINNTKDGTFISVIDVNADTIKVLGAADVFLQINSGEDRENNYDIEVGSGDDIIDMRADTVRPDDSIDDALDAPNVPVDGIAGDSTNEADIVRGGAGRNVLIVDGGNDLGTINGLDSDDDVFDNLFDLQTIIVEADSFGSGGQEIVIDEAARNNTKLDTLLFTGEEEQTTDLLIGDDFVVSQTAPTGAGTLLIDSTDHDDSFSLSIDSKDQDTDIQRVNLDVRVNVEEGTSLEFIDTGVAEAKVDITVENSDEANTTISDTDAGFGTEGSLDLDVLSGEIDSIKILDTAAPGSKEGTNGFDVDDFDLYVTVSDAWSGSGPTAEDTLLIDASAILDTDDDDDTGGGNFDLTAETDALLTVSGTQNDDLFVGSSLDDTLLGNGGDDEIFGELGNDVISGGDGDDILAGKVGDDKIDGGAGDDDITGGIGEDLLTGGTGADQFFYEAVAESNGDSPDLITDFETTIDKIEIDVDEAALAVDDVWNLGSFFAAPNVGQGDSSLQGTVPAPVRGDYFYATDGAQLVIDLDGNGDVTTLEDYVIGSTNKIAAGDVDFTIDLGGGKDLIRLGEGVDTITSSDGNDEFVIVGTINQAQANAYSLDPDPVGDADVAKVLTKGELSQVRTTTEVNDDDSINAGGANSTLHVYGTVNLVPVDLNASIETLVVHSDVTITLAQFLALDRLTFSGSSPHNLTVVTSDTDPTPANVAGFIAAGVPVLVDQYGSDGAVGSSDDATGPITINGAPFTGAPTSFNLDPTANPAVITFTSADVGNGNILDGGDKTNEDGGIAVRLIDGATTTRYSDEGTTFTRTDGGKYEVKDLPSGVSRGTNFDLVFLGTKGPENIGFSGLNDYVNTGLGDDIINANGGDDFLVGGGGNDTLTGGSGIDTFFVTAGSDTITADDLTASDLLRVGAAGTVTATVDGYTAGVGSVYNEGVVNLTSDKNVDLTNAGTGGPGAQTGYNVTLTGGGSNTVFGSDYNDTLVGDGSDNTLSAGKGTNTLTGGGGNDTFAVNGTDTVTDLSTGDVLNVGIAGNVTAAAAGGFVAGGATNNSGVVTINAGDVVNLLVAAGPNGYTVNDVSASGDKSLTGSNFNDTLNGGIGANTLLGLGGADKIYGGNDVGTDTLNGGTGVDDLTGGKGNDVFQYTLAGDATGGTRDGFLEVANTITDLNAASTLVGAEVIRDIAAGDSITFANASIVESGNDTLNADEFMLIQGAYDDNTDTFTVTAGGADSLLLFDNSSAANLQTEQVVLIGVTAAEEISASFAGTTLTFA